MKNSTAAVAVIVAVLVIAGGAFASFYNKSAHTSPNNTASTKTQAHAVKHTVLTTKTDPAIGQYLADPTGKALYTYGGDTSNASNCTGSCLSAWPAYTATVTANLPSGVGAITRTDNGQKQYTYNGKPLYYFVSDPAGQVTGNGVSDFTVAKPAAASSTGSSSSNGNSYPY